MKNYLSLAAALSLVATVAFAQTTPADEPEVDEPVAVGAPVVDDDETTIPRRGGYLADPSGRVISMDADTTETAEAAETTVTEDMLTSPTLAEPEPMRSGVSGNDMITTGPGTTQTQDM